MILNVQRLAVNIFFYNICIALALRATLILRTHSENRLNTFKLCSNPPTIPTSPQSLPIDISLSPNPVESTKKLNFLESLNPFKDVRQGLEEITAKGNKVVETHSDLPDSFEDMNKRATLRTLECISAGFNRIRIDIDTSVGDLTYTSIKNTLPVVKVLVNELAIGLDLSLPISMTFVSDPISDTNTTSSLSITNEMIESTMQTTFNPERTLTIFFPDMGAAALARRDWKFGSAFPEVPPCVFTANIQNDGLRDTDRMAIILCPRFSETEYVKRVIEICDGKNIPCVLVNPELINMDQGFGSRARNIRRDILGSFVTAYKLKTLQLGAIVREWPRGYTLWFEDERKPEGYALLRSYESDPTRETIDELFSVEEELLEKRRGKSEGKEGEGGAKIQALVGEVVGFFKGLSKL